MAPVIWFNEEPSQCGVALREQNEILDNIILAQSR